MTSAALLDGGGWGLPVPLFLSAPLETRSATRAEELPGVLDWLDGVASSGDPDRLAAGYISYEAGVWLEGSGSLVRTHEFLPLAAFGLFTCRTPARSAPPAAAPPSGATLRGPARRSLSAGSWCRAVDRIRSGIAAGDVYQVNLTRRTRLAGSRDPFTLASALRADNPVPYSVTLADRGWAVVSNSPELFLEVDLAAGRAVTKPIKGTIARGRSPAEDDARRRTLLASAKDAAELVMIVDLLRNDLGKVAAPGGVEVTEARALRTFRHLHHLEATVEARLAAGTRLSDVLRATLPGGSITGAPKRAALRFIHDLEPVPRGAYTGAAGIVRGNGRVVLDVAIRTAVLSAAHLDYHAGCGIVWDSEAEAEWREAETKSKEFVAAVAGRSTEREARGEP